MNVYRLIIHELEKEAKSTSITYKSSDSLLEINDGTTNLVTQIHNSFDKSLSQYSKFDTSKTTNAVYLNTNKYLANDDDDTFIELSKTSLSDLADDIKREPFATGGYYLFMDYIENGYRYISIIILRNTNAFNIKWGGNKFSVDPTENLNIDKLAMGFRLNCNLYNVPGEDRNYIALVSNQGDDLSKYFIKWVNADKVISNQVNTKTLVNIIKDLGPTDSTIDRGEFERTVFEWINLYRKQNSNTIDIDKLSESLYGNSLAIRDYANRELNTEIDPIFRVHPNELRRLVRLRAVTKGISVTIDTDKFDSEEVVIMNGTLIIKNKSIVESIEQQRRSEI